MSTRAPVIPDVLTAGLNIVSCGSAVGRRSAELRLPYAGPGNKFWPTLYAIGLTPKLWQPRDYRRLPEFGLGLTDLNKTESGSDASLTPAADEVAALREKIVGFRPRILAFTAK